MNIKDKLYDFFVKSNENVRYEYERYVMEHIEEHDAKRFKHLKILCSLIMHYNIKKNTTPLIYLDKLKNQIEVNYSNSNKTESKGPKIESKGPKIETKSPKSETKSHKIASGPNLPYLIGAESEASERIPAHIWVKGMFDYDVISFDIFDTLILRNVSDPKDIFMMLGEEHQIIDFYRIRIQAERDIKNIHQAIYGNKEATIYDIYNLIEKRTGLNKEIGVQKEFELECEICFVNPYIKLIYNILKNMSKCIYITSDMYFPKSFLSKLLEINGITNYKDLLVSCEYKGGKANGILYEILIEKEGACKKFVHIGDNINADIKSAQNYNIATRYYKNVQLIGNMYRERGMSLLTKAAYQGIVNTRLHNGTEHYTPQFEYGFTFGGLFVLGYVNWIHEQAKKNSIDKILFFARDGFIFKRIYDKLYQDIPSEYVFWSRTASLKYTCEYSRKDFLDRLVDHKLGEKVSIKSMLYGIGLESMEPLLIRYNLKSEEYIHIGNKEYLYNFFIENWEIILQIQKEGQSHAINYYQNVICDAKKVAFVDTGWRGDNQINLRRLLQEKSNLQCEIICFMAGTISAERNLSLIQKEIINCYMFSNNHNRGHFDSFIKNRVVNMAMFEMFTQSPHPSFDGFELNGEFKFGYAEVENYKIIEQIINGIESFCDEYIDKFGKYSYLMNISGYDAYLPFRGLTRHYRPAKNTLGMVKFQQGVGIDYSKQRTESFIQIMKQNGL